jgi:cyclic pyranopterin phosphate synthase
MADEELTHLDRKGQARMVDVGAKRESERVAVARGRVSMRAATLARITGDSADKGDVLAAARIAGIQAAKKTPELIPLCHGIRLTSVKVELEPDEGSAVLQITATARAVDRTGVEMEALTAVAVAALTVYDMLKAIDREMVIGEIALHEKRGGKSGDFVRGA